MTSLLPTQPALLEVPEMEDLPLHSLRLRADRVRREMEEGLQQLILRASTVSIHHSWLRDALEDLYEGACSDWVRHVGRRLGRSSRESDLYEHEARDCAAAVDLILAYGRALEDLKQVEWQVYRATLRRQHGGAR